MTHLEPQPVSLAPLCPSIPVFIVVVVVALHTCFGGGGGGPCWWPDMSSVSKRVVSNIKSELLNEKK